MGPDPSQKYLFDSLDILIEFGVLLGLAAWQKQIPASAKDSFEAIVEVSFSLLQEGRPQVADRILRYALSVKSKGALDQTIKMMIVSLAIANKMVNLKANVDEILDKTDWSAAGLQFKFCIASLREDIEESTRLMPILKAASEISPMAIREWPAFQWVRSNSQFIASFKETFGESLESSKVIKKSGDGESNTENVPEPAPNQS